MRSVIVIGCKSCLVAENDMIVIGEKKVDPVGTQPCKNSLAYAKFVENSLTRSFLINDFDGMSFSRQI